MERNFLFYLILRVIKSSFVKIPIWYTTVYCSKLRNFHLHQSTAINKSTLHEDQLIFLPLLPLNGFSSKTLSVTQQTFPTITLSFVHIVSSLSYLIWRPKYLSPVSDGVPQFSYPERFLCTLSKLGCERSVLKGFVLETNICFRFISAFIIGIYLHISHESSWWPQLKIYFLMRLYLNFIVSRFTRRQSSFAGL